MAPLRAGQGKGQRKNLPREGKKRETPALEAHENPFREDDPMRRSRTSIFRLAPLAGLALAAAATASVPLAASSAGAQTRQCFRATDWRGSASGGPRDLYIRVNINDIWHLALAQDCPGARYPGPVSIGDVVSGGSNEICSGVDLQITVRPRGGSNSTACIVKSIDKLTPEAVKALPKKAVPD